MPLLLPVLELTFITVNNLPITVYLVVNITVYHVLDKALPFLLVVLF